MLSKIFHRNLEYNNKGVASRGSESIFKKRLEVHMPASDFINIFAAKDQVNRILREKGAQSYSRILMNSQLPEVVLQKVLELLEKEHKIVANKPSSQYSAETIFQPASGSWGFSGWNN
jgi:hypothetical protein